MYPIRLGGILGAALFRTVVLLVGVLSAASLSAEELPPRAVTRIGDHRFYHGPGLDGAVLSPNGRRVASRATYLFVLHHTAAESKAYEKAIIVWDAATGERLRELEVPHAPAGYLTFSADSKQLAVAYGRENGKSGIVVFEVETGQLVRQLAEVEGLVKRLYFSADGKELRVAEDGQRVTAWDIESGKRRREWTPTFAATPEWTKGREHVWEGEPSPDGKYIAWCAHEASGDGPPSIFSNLKILVVSDAATNKPLYRREFPAHALNALVFSGDGRRFATGGDKVTVWETATSKELSAVEVSSPWTTALSPDGKQVVIDDRNMRVQIWDVETHKMVREVVHGFAYLGNSNLETPQAFAADGKTLLLTTNSTLRLFDLATGKERPFGAHRTPIVPSFAADGRTLVTTCDEARCRWDVSSGKDPDLLGREPRKVWEGICGERVLTHSDNGRVFLDEAEGRVRVRATATGRILKELEGDTRGTSFGQFSPNATRILLERTFYKPPKPSIWQLYDATTGKPSGTIEAPDLVGQPAFSPDARFVAWVDRANVVHLHDAGTGKPVRTLQPSRPLPQEKCDAGLLVFSPDGENLAAITYLGNDGLDSEGRHTLPTCVYDVASGRERNRFYYNPDKEEDAAPLACAVWSPDGRLLAVSEEQSGIIRLIEVASGKARAELVGHRDGVHGLAFSPDGKTLASGGADNVVYLWDVTGARTGTAAPKPAGEKELLACWNDLAADDAKKADSAAASLLRARGASVAFFKDRLKPAEAVDATLLARLLAGLDANDFAQREAASAELAKLGESAETEMRRALKDGPPPEAKRRLEALLAKLDRSQLPPETLRELRTIEVLEHLDTPEARQVLEALAKGASDARLTRQAQAALTRLASQRPS